MATLTIRNLDEAVKRRLRVRAAEHGRSMEEEVREILREAVSEQRGADLAASIRARVAGIGGVELELPAREPVREPSLLD